MEEPKRIPESGPEKWTWSDKLAIALACLAAIMALAILWIDKTPLWASVTIGAMALLIVYPIIHFVPSWKARIPVLLVAWAMISFFGWKIWPRPLVKPQSPAAALYHNPEARHSILPTTPRQVKPPVRAKTAPSTPAPSVKIGGDVYQEAGLCSINNIGGTVSGNTCTVTATPELKITSTEAERPSRDSRHPFYREIYVVPNVIWSPVSLDVICSTDIKSISPNSPLMFIELGDGYVYPQNSRMGHVSFEGPPVNPGQKVTISIWADDPFTCEKPTLSSTPRRRNAIEGPE